MSYAVSVEDWQRDLPSAVWALVGPSAAAAARLRLAQGNTPLPPQSLVLALSFLSAAAAPELACAARATLGRLPDALLLTVFAGDCPGLVRAALLWLLGERPVLLDALVGDPRTPDAALAAWAPQAPAHQAELLAQDGTRLQRSAALVAGLAQNPLLAKSTLERLVCAGLIPDVPAAADVLAHLSPEALQMAAAQICLPDAAQAFFEAPQAADAPLAPGAVSPQLQATEPAAQADAAADLDADADAERQKPMLKLVAELNMAQKIALATKGNKEARSILLRDANRVVAVAAIRNPRITEQEVQTAAKSRSVCDEVIRIIANSKDMTRSYSTKLALVNNPKVPLSIALRLLSSLRGVDLRAVAKSKGLPQTLVAQAKKLAQNAATGS